MGGGAGRGITGREGRSASRIHVHSSEDAPLPLLISPSSPPRWKQVRVINLPAGGRLVSPGMVPCLGLSVGLCCWQMRPGSSLSQVSLA